MQLGTKLGLGLGNILLDGDPAPTPKKRHSPQFLTHVRCGQMAQLIKMQLAMETGLRTSDFVLDKDPVPLKKGAQPPIFAYVCCDQTVGCIKLPLGTEIGLGPGDILLDGYPAPPFPKKGGKATPAIFGPCLLWPNGWMEKDATLIRMYGSGHTTLSAPLVWAHVHCGHGRLAHLSCCSALVCNLLHQILRLLTVAVSFDVKRRSLMLFPVLRKPEVVFNGQTVVNRSKNVLVKVE